MLTDDSAGEQRATLPAFADLSVGEQQVNHLLSRKHLDAAILRRFPGKALHLVATALRSTLINRRTRVRREQSVDKAITAAQTAD